MGCGALLWHLDAVKRGEEERRAADVRRAAELQQQQAAAERRREAVAKDGLEKLYSRWQDAERLALSSPVIGRAGPVASMQELRREAQSFDVPPCLIVARAKLVSGMTLSINGLLSAMSDPRTGDFVYVAATRPKVQKDLQFFRSAVEGCRT